MNQFHKSVLKTEAIDFLNVKIGGIYLDATVGGGGHTEEIIRRGGIVIGLDRDPEAIEYVKSKDLKKLTLVNVNFSHIKKVLEDLAVEKVDGILFDLGVSSHQLDKGERGFSFQKEGPLDMRMDPKLTVTAYDIINHFDTRRLNEVFSDFGEERFGWRIASAINVARKVKAFSSTQELAACVSEVYWRARVKTKLHPATKVFQALRIVVNSEILNLEEILPQTVKILKISGRLVVISFHSLEDKVVKRVFKQEKELKILTKKPVGPDLEEIKINPRARSAKLRAAEKI